jgi:hypothetical protein
MLVTCTQHASDRAAFQPVAEICGKNETRKEVTSLVLSRTAVESCQFRKSSRSVRCRNFFQEQESLVEVWMEGNLMEFDNLAPDAFVG